MENCPVIMVEFVEKQRVGFRTAIAQQALKEIYVNFLKVFTRYFRAALVSK